MATLRQHTSQAIAFTSVFSGLLIAWQAVRFCSGEIGLPFEVASALHGTMNWFRDFGRLLSGAASWVGLGNIVTLAGYAISRIVDVGAKQGIAEINSASKKAIGLNGFASLSIMGAFILYLVACSVKA